MELGKEEKYRKENEKKERRKMWGGADVLQTAPRVP